MASYHSPLTKSPIHSPYPSASIQQHHAKLAHQAQDTYNALRRIAAVSALDCAPPRFARASPPPCPARPRIPPAMRPRMSPSPPLPSPSPPSPPAPPPASPHAPTHSARGTVTTHRLGFRKRRNASRGHVEGFRR